MQVRKQQLEPDMEQQTGSIYEKEYVKTVYSQTQVIRLSRIPFSLSKPYPGYTYCASSGTK